MKFSDGIEINMQGRYRIIEEFDGLYVVGNDGSTPVKNIAEGKALIKEMKRRFQEDDNE